MKSKLLNALLIVTSLFGYMEWGGGNHLFLFQAEGQVLAKMFTDPMSVLHPFTHHLVSYSTYKDSSLCGYIRPSDFIVFYFSAGCLEYELQDHAYCPSFFSVCCYHYTALS